MNTIQIETRKVENDTAVYSLNGKLNISTVKDAWNQVMQEINRAERFEFDLECISFIDTSGNCILNRSISTNLNFKPSKSLLIAASSPSSLLTDNTGNILKETFFTYSSTLLSLT